MSTPSERRWQVAHKHSNASELFSQIGSRTWHCGLDHYDTWQRILPLHVMSSESVKQLDVLKKRALAAARQLNWENERAAFLRACGLEQTPCAA